LGFFFHRHIFEVVASERHRTRCWEQLKRLSESSLDCESIQRETIAEVQRVIGFDRWCWVLADPDTLIPLRGIAEHDYGPTVPRVLELEYFGDFAAMDAVARQADPVGSLSADTGGDPPRSLRWDEVLRRVGIGDEAVVACRDAFGCWGWIKAYRAYELTPARARRRRGRSRWARHPRSHRTPLHLAPHRPGSSQVGIREDRRAAVASYSRHSTLRGTEARDDSR
jgi:hypothetical protein